MMEKEEEKDKAPKAAPRFPTADANCLCHLAAWRWLAMAADCLKLIGHAAGHRQRLSWPLPREGRSDWIPVQGLDDCLREKWKTPFCFFCFCLNDNMSGSVLLRVVPVLARTPTTDCHQMSTQLASFAVSPSGEMLKKKVRAWATYLSRKPSGPDSLGFFLYQGNLSLN